MKKTIILLLTTFCCSASMMAQTDDNALRINFTSSGNPIETEHLLEGTHITFSDDGEQMNLKVNNVTATYNLSNVSGISHFHGTPSVSLHANEDPDNAGKFYTTFYSGLEAYTLPEGVRAYTAEVDGDAINLTRIEGSSTNSGQVILPQGEAVLLYSNELPNGNWTMEIADPSSASASNTNQFEGVDVATEQEAASYYMLSYGQNMLGFYKMNPSTLLAANKAFIVQSSSAPTKAMRMVFVENEVTSIASPLGETGEGVSIYNLNGIRLNKLQKGINIVNGKKIVVN